MKGPLRLHLPSAAMRLSMPTKRLRMSLDGRVINAGPPKFLTLEKLTETDGTQVGQLRELVELVGGIPVHVEWYEWTGVEWQLLGVATGLSVRATSAAVRAIAATVGARAAVVRSGRYLGGYVYDLLGWHPDGAELVLDDAESPAAFGGLGAGSSGDVVWTNAGIVMNASSATAIAVVDLCDAYTVYDSNTSGQPHAKACTVSVDWLAGADAGALSCGVSDGALRILGLYSSVPAVGAGGGASGVAYNAMASPAVSSAGMVSSTRLDTAHVRGTAVITTAPTSDTLGARGHSTWGQVDGVKSALARSRDVVGVSAYGVGLTSIALVLTSGQATVRRISWGRVTR